jgi:hypothetical protein
MLSQCSIDAETVQFTARSVLVQCSDNNNRTTILDFRQPVLELEALIKMAWREQTASMLKAREL